VFSWQIASSSDRIRLSTRALVSPHRPQRLLGVLFVVLVLLFWTHGRMCALHTPQRHANFSLQAPQLVCTASATLS